MFATMFKRILIPTDGSTPSRKAAKAAIAYARKVGARLTAYHAVRAAQPYLGGEGALMDSPVIAMAETAARNPGEQYVTEIAKAARTAGVPCATYVTRAATAYRGILDAAKRKKCDAIFIASHGSGAGASLLLGSVTQRVLAHSKVPAIVHR
jgi:nucleotide-binding universal stress UspA family protein